MGLVLTLPSPLQNNEFVAFNTYQGPHFSQSRVSKRSKDCWSLSAGIKWVWSVLKFKSSLSGHQPQTFAVAGPPGKKSFQTSHIACRSRPLVLGIVRHRKLYRRVSLRTKSRRMGNGRQAGNQKKGSKKLTQTGLEPAIFDFGPF